jgi:putative endonuclease
MADHNLTGAAGEEAACDFLRSKGFEVLERNWRHGRHELDIVARHDRELVFVEVKTRSASPADAFPEPVKRGQRSRIIKAANAYIAANGCTLGVRFDVVSVLVRPGRPPVIQHIPEAFYPRIHDKPF